MFHNEEVRRELLPSRRIVDEIIADETSVMYPHDIWPLLFIHPQVCKSALIGDSHQLPPFGSRSQGESLFDVALQDVTIPQIFLDLSFRLAAPLTKHLSRIIYSNALHPAPYKPESSLHNHLTWMDVPGQEIRLNGQVFNFIEALLIQRHVYKARCTEPVLVLAPCQTQVQLLRALLAGFENITVSTVDGAQGAEFKTVIFSCVCTK
jgi:AAA domain